MRTHGHLFFFCTAVLSLIGSACAPNHAAAQSSPPKVLSCADRLLDTASNECIQASSLPLEGALYPLGPHFFIDPQGRVGIGTLTPTAGLHVIGKTRVEGALHSTRLDMHSDSKPAISIRGQRNNDIRVFNLDGNQAVLLAGSQARLVLGNQNGSSPPGWFQVVDSGGSKACEISGDHENLIRVFDESGVSISLDRHGKIQTRTIEITGGMDIAEPFPVRESPQLVPGALVVIDPEKPGGLMLSKTEYDKKVLGVISGAGGIEPGLTLRQEGHTGGGTQLVALTGRVYCRANTSNGRIEPGDLLTTSAVAGEAMRAIDTAPSNVVIGKAMTSLDSGSGLVLVVVNN